MDEFLINISEKLQSFEEKPESVLETNEEVHTEAIQWCQFLHDEIQRIAPKGGLKNLLIEGFADDQIFTQMEMLNGPLCSSAKRNIEEISEAFEAGSFRIREKPEEPEDEEMEEDEEDQEDEEDEDEDDEEESVERPAKKAKSDKTGLNDAFFKLDSMEAFVKDAERLAENEGEESSDEEEDFDITAAANLDENMKYEDFFDPVDEGEVPDMPNFDEMSDNNIGSESEESEEEAEEMDEEERHLDKLLDQFVDEIESGEESTDDEEEIAAFKFKNLKKTKSQVAKEKRLAAEAEQEPEEDEEAEDKDEEAEDKDEEAENEEDDEEADEPEDWMEEDDASEDDEVPATSSVTALQKKLDKLNDEIAQLEDEQMANKHWSMTGEAYASDRPLNSLIETHIDLPMSHFATKRAVDAALAGGYADVDDEKLMDSKPALVDLEKIIKQRIKDALFDDVTPVLKQRPADKTEATNPEDEVDTKKSKIGLGELYAQQYEKEVLGNNHDDEQNKEKVELKRLFAKLMFQLDQLSNNHFTPKPAAASKTANHGDAAAITMEETIPLMMSSAGRAAPHEVQKGQKSDKVRAEMDPAEKKALRRADKARRSKKMESRLESGEISLQGLRQRNAKLLAKNKEERQAKADKKAGVDHKALRQKKKIRSTELLAKASERVHEDASKKAAKKSNSAAAKLKL